MRSKGNGAMHDVHMHIEPERHMSCIATICVLLCRNFILNDQVYAKGCSFFCVICLQTSQAKIKITINFYDKQMVAKGRPMVKNESHHTVPTTLQLAALVSQNGNAKALQDAMSKHKDEHA